MRLAAVLAACAGLALIAAGCGDDAATGSSGGRAELVVSAAASMSEALASCAPRFEQAEDVELRLSFAGSDELAAQVRQGAGVDAYAAANTSIPDDLHAEGLLREPVEFASNELVLAAPSDSDVDSVEDAGRDGTAVVIGSEAVPIGSYTRATLAKLPPALERAILANVRSNEPDVRAIVGKLVQGAADAGFVYLTDVRAAGEDLEAIELPAELEPEVTYAAGVVSASEEPEPAGRFVEGLTRGPCADALREAGFGAAPR